MFATAKDWSTMVNLDHVVELHQSGKHGTRAVLRDGRSVALACDPCSVAKLAVPVVKAEPGFELLIAWFGDEVFVHRQPVLAWRCAEFGVEPIVIDSVGVKPGDSSSVAIKLPNGTLIDQHNDVEWASEDAWLVEMNERNAEYLANERRAKASAPSAA
jgi:hypothetical protein